MNSVVCETQNIGLNDGKFISDPQSSKFQWVIFLSHGEMKVSASFPSCCFNTVTVDC